MCCTPAVEQHDSGRQSESKTNDSGNETSGWRVENEREGTKN
jgi:hypothetical protein